MSEQVVKPSRHHVWRISLRALSKSWDDSIFSESAQAGFWCALSLPPLLLGMLGSLAYVAPLFGPDTLPSSQRSAISTAHKFFSPSVVNEIIEPPIHDIANNARGEVVSLGFLISMWAGSSAMSAFVDSVVEAHDQTPLRHPVRQRLFALFLYMVMLVVVVALAPVVGIGPRKGGERIPDGLANLLHYGYYPALVLGLVVGIMILYRVALPVPLPSHRLVLGAMLATTVFLVSALGLRFYLRWITSTGYTYGALSTPIAFLLFAFFGGFAIMLVAELNAAVQEEFPAPKTHAHRLRNWIIARYRRLGETTPTATAVPPDTAQRQEIVAAAEPPA